MGLVTSDPGTLISSAAMSWRLAVSLLCLVLMGGLILRKFRSAFVVSILGISIFVIILTAIIEPDNLVLAPFGQFDMSKTAGKLNFNFDWRAFYLIPLLLLHHLFDAVGTSLVLLRQAYFSNTKIQFNNEELENSIASSSKVRSILLVDAFYIILSAILGSSPTTPFIESATGISVGAKTGLASVISGFLFIISIFIGPIVQYIAPEATGPALMITAMLLLPMMKHLNFDRFEEVLPAAFTIIAIPFTFSIADGAALGYCFLLSWVLAGKWKKVTPIMWVLMTLSALQIIETLLYNESKKN